MTEALEQITKTRLRRRPRYPAYKNSGVEWLGEIPAHWAALPIKRICRLCYGKSLASDDRENGDVVVFGSNGPVGTHNRANTHAPCVIVGRKGSFGKVNYSTDEVFTIDTAFVVDARFTRGNLRWLYYTLQCARLDTISKDSAIPGLAREDAYAHEIAVGPLDEQAAIAAFLDHETAKIDGLVERQERLIDLLQEKRTAVITRAVTRGLDPHVPMKDSGVEWLGEIPAHWKEGRLGNSVKGCIAGIWGSDPNGRDDLICVRVADFDRSRLRIRLTQPTLRAIAHSERFQRLLRRGDLLLEKSGGGDLQPVGAVMLYDYDDAAVCSNFVARMPVSSWCNAKFLVYLHAHLYAIRLTVRSIKQTTGIQNLSSNSYLSETVAYPPLSEQVAIATFLDRETARIDHVITKIRYAIGLLKEFRTALISAAVTGKIDVRASSSETPKG